ncbi:MAG: hypothetical protein HIU84_09920 [Acidobacteria bacterium]|nr:hypothetical protein [Acidobacteriota bacterium]
MDILGLLKQIFDAVTQFLSDSLTQLLTWLATLLTTSIVPTFALFKLEWFSTQLGAVVGVAQSGLILVCVIVGLFMIGKPFATHTQVTGRLFSSIGMLVLFVVGFYPAIDVALALSVGLRDFLIMSIAGIQRPELNKVMDTYMLFIPGVPGGYLIALLVLTVLAGILWVVTIGILLMTFVVILVYPVTLVLRPLGKGFDKLFHAANAAIIVALVSPPFMATAVMLPVLASKIPFIGNYGGQLIAAILGLGLAIAAPFILGRMVYKKSIGTFGKVEARISGTVDARWPQHTPGGNGSENKPSSMLAFGSAAAVGAAGAAITSKSPDQLVAKIRHVAANAAAVGLGAAGHPGLAGVIKTVDETQKSKESREATANTTVAALQKAQPQPASPPPPTTAAPGPSPKSP